MATRIAECQKCLLTMPGIFEVMWHHWKTHHRGVDQCEKKDHNDLIFHLLSRIQDKKRNKSADSSEREYVYYDPRREACFMNESSALPSPSLPSNSTVISPKEASKPESIGCEPSRPSSPSSNGHIQSLNNAVSSDDAAASTRKFRIRLQKTYEDKIASTSKSGEQLVLNNKISENEGETCGSIVFLQTGSPRPKTTDELERREKLNAEGIDRDFDDNSSHERPGSSHENNQKTRLDNQTPSESKVDNAYQHPFKCGQCDKSFPTIPKKLLHRMAEHNNINIAALSTVIASASSSDTESDGKDAELSPPSSQTENMKSTAYGGIDDSGEGHLVTNETLDEHINHDSAKSKLVKFLGLVPKRKKINNNSTIANQNIPSDFKQQSRKVATGKQHRPASLNPKSIQSQTASTDVIGPSCSNVEKNLVARGKSGVTSSGTTSMPSVLSPNKISQLGRVSDHTEKENLRLYMTPGGAISKLAEYAMASKKKTTESGTHKKLVDSAKTPNGKTSVSSLFPQTSNPRPKTTDELERREKLMAEGIYPDFDDNSSHERSDPAKKSLPEKKKRKKRKLLERETDYSKVTSSKRKFSSGGETVATKKPKLGEAQKNKKTKKKSLEKQVNPEEKGQAVSKGHKRKGNERKEIQASSSARDISAEKHIRDKEIEKNLKSVTSATFSTGNNRQGTVLKIFGMQPTVPRPPMKAPLSGERNLHSTSIPKKVANKKTTAKPETSGLSSPRNQEGDRSSRKGKLVKKQKKVKEKENKQSKHRDQSSRKRKRPTKKKAKTKKNRVEHQSQENKIARKTEIHRIFGSCSSLSSSNVDQDNFEDEKVGEESENSDCFIVVDSADDDYDMDVDYKVSDDDDDDAESSSEEDDEVEVIDENDYEASDEDDDEVESNIEYIDDNTASDENGEVIDIGDNDTIDYIDNVEEDHTVGKSDDSSDDVTYSQPSYSMEDIMAEKERAENAKKAKSKNDNSDMETEQCNFPYPTSSSTMFENARDDALVVNHAENIQIIKKSPPQDGSDLTIMCVRSLADDNSKVNEELNHSYPHDEPLDLSLKKSPTMTYNVPLHASSIFSKHFQPIVRLERLKIPNPLNNGCRSFDNGTCWRTAAGINEAESAPESSDENLDGESSDENQEMGSSDESYEPTEDDVDLSIRVGSVRSFVAERVKLRREKRERKNRRRFRKMLKLQRNYQDSSQEIRPAFDASHDSVNENQVPETTKSPWDDLTWNSTEKIDDVPLSQQSSVTSRSEEAEEEEEVTLPRSEATTYDEHDFEELLDTRPSTSRTTVSPKKQDIEAEEFRQKQCDSAKFTAQESFSRSQQSSPSYNINTTVCYRCKKLVSNDQAVLYAHWMNDCGKEKPHSNTP